MVCLPLPNHVREAVVVPQRIQLPVREVTGNGSVPTVLPQSLCESAKGTVIATVVESRRGCQLV